MTAPTHRDAPRRVRHARNEDVTALGHMAAELVRLHHETDPGRFLDVPDPATGYGRWLQREATRDRAVVLVGLVEDAVCGYAYGTLEGRDWNALLDEHGVLHDVFVVERARRSGLGRELVVALVDALEARGAPRIVLSTMVTNRAAQELFASCGFRPTMLEMTRNAQALR